MMSWLFDRMPERGQRQVFWGGMAITAAVAAVGVLTSREQDWHPLSLFLVLLIFNVAGELLAVRRNITVVASPLVISSTAPLVLAMTLMGPAPALLIVAVGLVAAAIHERTPPWAVAANFANLGTCVVAGGLVARWLVEASGATPDEPRFALIFVAVFTLMTIGSWLLNSISGNIANGDSIREQWDLEVPRLGAELLLGLLSTTAAYAYGKVGLGALGLLALVQLTQQYLIRNLVLSEDRAEALRRRADELASLHARLQAQADRLAEVSESRGRLVGQVLQAEETERRRLAEALHDEALQELLSARLGLAPIADGEAERSRAGIDRAIDQLRRAIFDLHPAVLEHAGLAAALYEVAEHQAERAGFRADIKVDPEACGPHDPLLFVLGREQLTNAAKHAKATEVELAVSRDNGQVVLEVADNGRGMDPERRRSAVEHGHIGLASSAERVEALGGQFEVDSEPGRGTRIRTTIPVDEA